MVLEDRPMFVSRALVLTALAAALFFSPVTNHASDWPQWRGPNLDGTVEAGGVFDADNVGLEIAWSRDLGPAYSGISIVGERAVTTFSDGESDWVVALKVDDGAEIWRYRIDAVYKGHDGSDDGPISMPAVEGDVVYALGARGQLFALSLADGSELWRVSLEEMGAPAPRYGFTTSPLVVGDVLFVETGAKEGRCYCGFDKKTGEVLWSSGEGTVAYQSPTLARLAGRDQIVAVSDTHALGLVPESGELLWSHEFAPDGREGASQPVLVGEHRVLLNGQTDSVLLGVKAAGEAFEVEEVWRTTALKGSLAAPVFHEEHLYGFDGDFLTCVDAATGEKVWKSRPPGGRGLILVDGHLVIFAPNGELVVARATPEGYDEVARTEVSNHGGYTWPSFADGKIFVRNKTQIASIGITEIAPTVAREAIAPAPANEFEVFVRAVEASDNRRGLVDDFMTDQSGFPVIEDERLVHFVYRGEVEDIAITGTMTEFFAEEPLNRVADTDLYYATYEFDAGRARQGLPRRPFRLAGELRVQEPDPGERARRHRLPAPRVRRLGQIVSARDRQRGRGLARSRQHEELAGPSDRRKGGRSAGRRLRPHRPRGGPAGRDRRLQVRRLRRDAGAGAAAAPGGTVPAEGLGGITSRNGLYLGRRRRRAGGVDASGAVRQVGDHVALLARRLARHLDRAGVEGGLLGRRVPRVVEPLRAAP
jgi:outer membrane protein assembly factor BamB